MWLEYDGDTLPKTVTKKEDLRNEFGRFCYLEAHEYRMFNTCELVLIALTIFLFMLQVCSDANNCF